MKERPILFNGEMVRAILEGRKAQTRRVVKHQPCGGWEFDGVYGKITSHHPQRGKFGAFLRRGVDTSWPELGIIPCPFGQPGDRLWVKETYAAWPAGHDDPELIYRAHWSVPEAHAPTCKGWTPSIHMPRWASRITRKITNIRVERLNKITRGDAMAEGCPFPNMADGPDPREWFSDLWESINGKGSWDANPWVWVIEFRKLDGGAA